MSAAICTFISLACFVLALTCLLLMCHMARLTLPQHLFFHLLIPLLAFASGVWAAL